MRIGLVGLGRMGAGILRRLTGSGHEVVGFDLAERARATAVASGGRAASSLEELVAALPPPRAIWMMVPAGEPTEATLASLLPLLASGDLIADGANSLWSDSVRRAATCSKAGVEYLDVGVSGGVWGLEQGFCLMAGGTESAFRRLEPVLQSLAPPGGLAHVGPSGAGHFVKMIHNAIEYGMLQAYAEGFECLRTSPFDIDTYRVAEVWRHGAVVRSWMLDLLARAYEEEGNDLARIAGWVDDSGTGRWSVEYAIEQAVPVPVLSAALFARFRSRQDDSYAAKVIAALRNQFGGHAVHEEGGEP